MFFHPPRKLHHQTSRFGDEQGTSWFSIQSLLDSHHLSFLGQGSSICRWWAISWHSCSHGSSIMNAFLWGWWVLQIGCNIVTTLGLLILYSLLSFLIDIFPYSTMTKAPSVLIVGAYQCHHRESSDDAHRRQFWGGNISWATNKSASARNTTVAFYPGVYRGVIYISAGNAVNGST